MSGDLTQDQGRGRGRQQGETPSLKGITAGADIFKDGKALPMDDVREKLKNLEQHLPNQHESVYEFGRLLAGRLNSQLVPAGFNLTAELLLHDLQAGVDGFSGKPIGSNLAGQPAIVYGILRMSIPDITAAVSPKEFSEGVGQVVSEVNAKIKEDHDKARQANPPQAIEIDLKDYFRRAQAICKHIFDTVNGQEGCSMFSRLEESPNPFYGQVNPNGGIALEQYYSSPSRLMTPLGQLEISGGSSSSGDGMSKVWEKLTADLGLVEIVPVKHTREGTFGPIFAITKDLEGNQLPVAELTKRVSYVEYEEAKKIWKDVKPEGRND